MNLNLKLYFKYILLNTNFFFTKYLFRNDKNINFVLTNNCFFFIIIHLKLSSLFFSSQLSDIFAYEYQQHELKLDEIQTAANNNLALVYNFHNLKSQQRFYLFIVKNSKINVTFNSQTSVTSISEVFSSANWLEREASELNGIFFKSKKDLRNLLLQYGDSSAPFQKSYPAIGMREIAYDSVSDYLIQTPISIQF